MISFNRQTLRSNGWRPRFGCKPGVTILELLVVISCITMLASLLFPAVHSARECAHNLECMNNLRQIGLALHKYHDAHRELPPGWNSEACKRTSYGWAASILKELEEPSLHEQIDRTRPIDELVSSVRTSTPAVYVCPSDYGDAVFPLYAEIGAHGVHAQESTQVLVTLPRASYVGVFGTTDPDDVPGTSGNGAFVQNRGRRFADMTRGLSHVELVGERTTRKLASTWIGFATEGEDAPGRVVGYADLGPNRDDADECEFDSRHAEHVNFAWADGHVDGVQNDIDRQVYEDEAKCR